jgi:hypothetical protein
VLLVIVGVRADGTKELIAVADGERESGDAWAELLQAADPRWWAVNGPYLVALVRAGARFERGRLVERPATPAAEAAA